MYFQKENGLCDRVLSVLSRWVLKSAQHIYTLSGTMQCPFSTQLSAEVRVHSEATPHNLYSQEEAWRSVDTCFFH